MNSFVLKITSLYSPWIQSLLKFVSWEFLLLGTVCFGLILGIAVYIWLKNNYDEPDFQETNLSTISEQTSYCTGLSQVSGNLDGHIVLLSSKEGGLDDLKTCRFFLQPEYVCTPSRTDAIGVFLNLGSPETGEFNSIFPVKGSLFLKMYRGPHQGVVHNKSKLSVGLGGEGKRSYLQVNESIFNFVFELEIPYDFSFYGIGSVSLLQPPPNSFGICGYVKRESRGIRLVKTSTAGRVVADMMNHDSNFNCKPTNLFMTSNMVHQIVVPLAETGYSLATNHAIAWIPNKGIVDVPQITPPPDFLLPQNLKGKLPYEHAISSLQFEDVTEKMKKWVGTLLKEAGDLACGSTLEFKVKYHNLKVGNRFSIGWSDYFNQQYTLFQQQQNQILIQPFSSKQFSVEKNFETFVLDVITRELAPFLSVFSIRKFDPLGKGVVLIQSSTEPLQWLKSWNDDSTLNRQWVVNYCPFKELKKMFSETSSQESNPFHSLDRDAILKTVSEMNFKNQCAVLMVSGSHHSTFNIFPLIPSNDSCKKCPAISTKVDTLVINCDFQINKFSTIDLTSQILKKNC